MKREISQASAFLSAIIGFPRYRIWYHPIPLPTRLLSLMGRKIDKKEIPNNKTNNQ